MAVYSLRAACRLTPPYVRKKHTQDVGSVFEGNIFHGCRGLNQTDKTKQRCRLRFARSISGWGWLGQPAHETTRQKLRSTGAVA